MAKYHSTCSNDFYPHICPSLACCSSFKPQFCKEFQGLVMRLALKSQDLTFKFVWNRDCLVIYVCIMPKVSGYLSLLLLKKTTKKPQTNSNTKPVEGYILSKRFLPHINLVRLLGISWSVESIPLTPILLFSVLFGIEKAPRNGLLPTLITSSLQNQ